MQKYLITNTVFLINENHTISLTFWQVFVSSVVHNLSTQSLVYLLRNSPTMSFGIIPMCCKVVKILRLQFNVFSIASPL